MNDYKNLKDELKMIEWVISEVEKQIEIISNDINQKLLQLRKNDDSSDKILINIGELASNRLYLKNTIAKYNEEKSVKESEIFNASKIKSETEKSFVGYDEAVLLDIVEDIFE